MPKMKPRARHLNAHISAMRRCAALSAADVSMQVDVVAKAIRAFMYGKATPEHWASLADTSNVSETLCQMRLGGGPEAERVIRDAQKVLSDVSERFKARGSWTLYAAEIDALQWLAQLHKTQLQVCSYGEFEAAYTKTVNRIKQARAGNVAEGVVVVEGLI